MLIDCFPCRPKVVQGEGMEAERSESDLGSEGDTSSHDGRVEGVDGGQVRKI